MIGGVFNSRKSSTKVGIRRDKVKMQIKPELEVDGADRIRVRSWMDALEVLSTDRHLTLRGALALGDFSWRATQ